jgi:hypothetical protein
MRLRTTTTTSAMMMMTVIIISWMHLHCALHDWLGLHVFVSTLNFFFVDKPHSYNRHTIHSFLAWSSQTCMHRRGNNCIKKHSSIGGGRCSLSWLQGTNIQRRRWRRGGKQIYACTFAAWPISVAFISPPWNRYFTHWTATPLMSLSLLYRQLNPFTLCRQANLPIHCNHVCRFQQRRHR